jgi:hypothetical protein
MIGLAVIGNIKKMFADIEGKIKRRNPQAENDYRSGNLASIWKNEARYYDKGEHERYYYQKMIGSYRNLY